jgi:hypothetical protein
MSTGVKVVEHAHLVLWQRFSIIQCLAPEVMDAMHN